MVYEIGQELRPVDWNGRSRDATIVVTAAPGELGKWQERLEFDIHTAEECQSITLCKLEAHGAYLFGTAAIPVCHAVVEKKESLAFYLFPQLLLLVDRTDRLQNELLSLAENKRWVHAAPVSILCDFLEARVGPDHPYLDELEAQITGLEEQVLSGKLQEFSHPMLALRKQLLYLSSFYEQMAEVGEDMEENDWLFPHREPLERLKRFTSRMQRLSSRAQTMREYSMQVWEMYQSQVDIRQNTIMKLLTVVTTLFMPLTLITGWYGMNFTGMGELHWKYGYPMIILVSAVVVLLCLGIFKKKKML